MANFSIGPFDFLSLSRPPSVPKRRLVREVRPGANGVTFWGTGKRAAPFAVLSVRDTADAGAATALLAAYQQLVGGEPVSLFWLGTLHSQVIVHDSEPLDDGVRQTLLGIGGLAGTSQGLLLCQWVLEFVEFTQEQQ